MGLAGRINVHVCTMMSDLSFDVDPDVGGLDVAVYERGVHETRALHLQLVATTDLILTKVKIIPEEKKRNTLPC